MIQLSLRQSGSGVAVIMTRINQEHLVIKVQNCISLGKWLSGLVLNGPMCQTRSDLTIHFLRLKVKKNKREVGSSQIAVLRRRSERGENKRRNDETTAVARVVLEAVSVFM